MDTTKYIWMDGKHVPWEKAQVHILTHAVHYGTAVFEGIRCYRTKRGPAVFRLTDHMKRLMGSAHIMGIKVPFTREVLEKAVLDTIRRNEIEECYIRPIVYLGYGKIGLNPVGATINVSIAVFPWGSYLGEEGVKNGIRAKVSSFCRGNVNAILDSAKTAGNYVNSVLAKREAVEDGYDEAIMLSNDGFVAEATGENLFIARNGHITTAPNALVLEGITRDTVMELATDAGIRVSEEMFTRDQLYLADEAWLTGTAAEITPVREVDRRAIGDGKPGPLTRRFQETFKKIVRGEDEKWARWLNYVD